MARNKIKKVICLAANADCRDDGDARWRGKIFIKSATEEKFRKTQRPKDNKDSKDNKDNKDIKDIKDIKDNEDNKDIKEDFVS